MEFMNSKRHGNKNSHSPKNSISRVSDTSSKSSSNHSVLEVKDLKDKKATNLNPMSHQIYYRRPDDINRRPLSPKGRIFFNRNTNDPKIESRDIKILVNKIDSFISNQLNTNNELKTSIINTNANINRMSQNIDKMSLSINKNSENIDKLVGVMNTIFNDIKAKKETKKYNQGNEFLSINEKKK